jgi:hypothetical protein
VEFTRRCGLRIFHSSRVDARECVDAVRARRGEREELPHMWRHLFINSDDRAVGAQTNVLVAERRSPRPFAAPQLLLHPAADVLREIL